MHCVANIRIFKYIRIFIDEYIHSYKYLWIFQTQIYSDIHLRLFPSHEYIRRFIRNVRFQRIHWFEAAQQNKFVIHKNLGNMTFQQVMFKKFPCPHLISNLHYPFKYIYQNIWSIFFIWIYSYIHSWIYCMEEYIWTFVRENVDNWIYSDTHSRVIGSNKYIRIFICQRKITFATHWFM